MLEAELGGRAKMLSLIQVATDSQSLAAMACSTYSGWRTISQSG